MKEKCCTCGQSVLVSTSDEGTGHYIPMERALALEEAAYQAEIFYGPGAGPKEAWRAGVEIAKVIRSMKKAPQPGGEK